MVSVNDIEVVIKEQENKMQKLFAEEKIIKRHVVINPKFPVKGAAAIILGPRRCGKSVLAYQLAKGEKAGYINFDDERLNIEASKLNLILEAIYVLHGDVDLILLDEIQEIAGWEKFVSRLVDSKRLIITGSNAKMMSKELATYMTGRHINIELLPFNFYEFLVYKDFTVSENGIYTTMEKARIISLLKEYMEIGGFPLGIKLGMSYLAELYNDIIQKDIIQRHKIRMEDKLRGVARYVVSRSASEISYNKLRNIFEIASKHTIPDWILYMEQAYLIFKIERFSFKLKESIMAPKKIYAVDTGFMNMLAQERDMGRAMESLVAIELLRRKNYSKNPIQINYWKNQKQEEVDFVIRHEKKVLELVQTTYASTYVDLKERELKGLLAASDELRCNTLKVITWDYEEERSIKGKTIAFVPLWKWLLDV